MAQPRGCNSTEEAAAAAKASKMERAQALAAAKKKLEAMFDGNRSTHDGKRYATRDLDFDGNGFVNGEFRPDHHLSDKGRKR